MTLAMRGRWASVKKREQRKYYQWCLKIKRQSQELPDQDRSGAMILTCVVKCGQRKGNSCAHCLHKGRSSVYSSFQSQKHKCASALPSRGINLGNTYSQEGEDEQQENLSVRTNEEDCKENAHIMPARIPCSHPPINNQKIKQNPSLPLQPLNIKKKKKRYPQSIRSLDREGGVFPDAVPK